MTENATDHTPADAAVIDAELARLILGGRGPRRPELRMDVVGGFARIAIGLRLVQLDVGRRLVPIVRDLARFVERVSPQLYAMRAQLEVVRPESFTKVSGVDS